VIPLFGRACWLGRLGVKVAASTAWQILETNGIDLAPRRAGSIWSQFLSSPAEALLACDFFSVDLPGGTHAYVLTVIEHARRARRSQRPNAVRRSERPELGVLARQFRGMPPRASRAPGGRANDHVRVEIVKAGGSGER
jgi:hypothetical protein